MIKSPPVPDFSELQAHAARWKTKSMREAFEQDPERAERYSVELGELYFDYSKHLIDDDVLRSLVQLAELAGVSERRDAMYAGSHINTTEDRPVLHVALRHRGEAKFLVDGRDIVPEVRAVLHRMRSFVGKIHDGSWTGATGKSIRDVVNIGIGGSDLGPLMVSTALKPYWHQGVRTHFVSNADGAHMSDVLSRVDLEGTLFVIASKTFTTLETMLNARTVRRKLTDAFGAEAVAKHFVAVSAAPSAVAEFGIPVANTFDFWPWVGGRYSLWSSVGLSVALAVGMDRFEELLHGASIVDDHFASAPLAKNVPVLMALLGVYYINGWGRSNHAIIPYAQHLSRFAAYFQQADMESNGKRTRLDGVFCDYATGPVVFGEPGTNSQHAFFQLLHQSPDFVPTDFIGTAQTHHALVGHHEVLVANLLAQPEALMRGKTEAEVVTELLAAGTSPERAAELAPHRAFAGNRPTTTLLLRKLTPRTLGMLIALYEHKIFVQGVVWGINSFDQWGVELGKELARAVLGDLQAGEAAERHDASTRKLIAKYIRWR